MRLRSTSCSRLASSHCLPRRRWRKATSLPAASATRAESRLALCRRRHPARHRLRLAEQAARRCLPSLRRNRPLGVDRRALVCRSRRWRRATVVPLAARRRRAGTRRAQALRGDRPEPVRTTARSRWAAESRPSHGLSPATPPAAITGRRQLSVDEVTTMQTISGNDTVGRSSRISSRRRARRCSSAPTTTASASAPVISSRQPLMRVQMGFDYERGTGLCIAVDGFARRRKVFRRHTAQHRADRRGVSQERRPRAHAQRPARHRHVPLRVRRQQLPAVRASTATSRSRSRRRSRRQDSGHADSGSSPPRRAHRKAAGQDDRIDGVRRLFRFRQVGAASRRQGRAGGRRSRA